MFYKDDGTNQKKKASKNEFVHSPLVIQCQAGRSQSNCKQLPSPNQICHHRLVGDVDFCGVELTNAEEYRCRMVKLGSTRRLTGTLAGRVKDRNTKDTPKRPFRCQSNPHCSSAAFPELSQGSPSLALSAKSGISACCPPW